MTPLSPRPLGNTGIKVSPLGLGTVKIGRDQGLKYPNRFQLPHDHEILALFEEARTLGINFIDTAPAYGTSEEKIGRLLPDRQDWVIGTKVGEEFSSGKSHFDFSGANADTFPNAVDESPAAPYDPAAHSVPLQLTCPASSWC